MTRHKTEWVIKARILIPFLISTLAFVLILFRNLDLEFDTLGGWDGVRWLSEECFCHFSLKLSLRKDEKIFR